MRPSPSTVRLTLHSALAIQRTGSLAFPDSAETLILLALRGVCVVRWGHHRFLVFAKTPSLWSDQGAHPLRNPAPLPLSSSLQMLPLRPQLEAPLIHSFI